MRISKVLQATINVCPDKEMKRICFSKIGNAPMLAWEFLSRNREMRLSKITITSNFIIVRIPNEQEQLGQEFVSYINSNQ